MFFGDRRMFPGGRLVLFGCRRALADSRLEFRILRHAFFGDGLCASSYFLWLTLTLGWPATFSGGWRSFSNDGLPFLTELP